MKSKSDKTKDKICPNCGEELNIFKTGIIYRKDNKRFCSIKCKNDYTGNNLKEIKCTCNQCGKVWHYLESDEKKLKSQATGNSLIACGTCCSPFSALFSNKSLELQREADKMKKCPNCNSTDVTKKSIYYEKKE